MDGGPVLFAVVDLRAGRRSTGPHRRGGLESALAADRFATDHRLDDYTVAPVAFRVDPAFTTGKDRS